MMTEMLIVYAGMNLNNNEKETETPGDSSAVKKSESSRSIRDKDATNITENANPRLQCSSRKDCSCRHCLSVLRQIYTDIERQDDTAIALQRRREDDKTACVDSHDVDGGWAWWVLGAGFVQFMVSSGIFYSWGVFFVPLLDSFNESRASTAWVFSTNAAVHQIAGPLGGFLIPRVGPRATVLLGGLLAATGCLISAYSSSLQLMYFSHGIINAIGTSLNFSGWVVGLSKFFVKRRSLALGLAMSGSGLGVLVLGPTLANIVPTIGWRKAMLLCSGLSLTFCIFGVFIYNNTKKNAQKNDDKSDKKISQFYNMNINHCSQTCTPQLLTGVQNITLQSNKTQYVPTQNIIDKDQLELDSINKRNNKLQWFAIQISCVLSIMATSTVFTLLKDWIIWIGLEEIASYSLMAAGVGDIIGRVLAGLLSWISKDKMSVLILFIGTHIMLTVSLVIAALAQSKYSVLCSVFGVGIAGGSQCVLTAVAPMDKESAKDLGKLLLAGGIGALFGPPFAGFLVDQTNNYSIALISCAGAPMLATVICTACQLYNMSHLCTFPCLLNSKNNEIEEL